MKAILKGFGFAEVCRGQPWRSRTAASNSRSQKGRVRYAAFVLLLLVSGLMTGTSSLAQYSISWHTIDGGGGTSTDGPIGSNYSVTGTIGQPDAGATMTNGLYSITGGFWPLPTGGQPPGAPVLIIVPSGPGQVAISWTPPVPGFVLQESTSLHPPTWTDVPGNLTNPVVVPSTLPSRFYRLHKE